MAKSQSSRKPAAPVAGRTTRVYAKLRELIVHGRLAPGTRVTETEAARRLGVSRTPLRAALQRLQQEGYVMATGNGRRVQMVVAPLTREDCCELMHILGEIEGLAAHNAAMLGMSIRSDLVATLNRLNHGLGRAAAAAQPEARLIFQLDFEFHLSIVSAGAGPRLLALHRAIKPQAERYGRYYAAALVSAIHLSVEEHDAVARAIARGDSDAAQSAMIHNWRNAAARLSQVIESAGEAGSW